MKALLLLALLLPATAWSQAPLQNPGVQKKDPKALPRTDPRSQTLNKAVAGEDRKFNAVSKAAKRRHDKAPNAIRNER